MSRAQSHEYLAQDADRARDALLSLDAGCSRDEWVRAGMAAKAAGLSEDDFLKWSAGASNFGGERDARAVWRSIKPDGGISAATLFHMAGGISRGDVRLRGRSEGPGIRASGPVHATRDSSNGERKPAADLETLLDGYPPAHANHAYIVAKRGSVDGLRVVPTDSTLTIQGRSVAGWLAVPACSLDGDLRTIQFIPPPGSAKKLNMPGASFGDGVFVVGEFATDGTIYVCEGIGQAWACARADYNAAAVVTFGAGRCRTVATLLRERHPAARIVVVPDRGKETDAEAVARDVAGALAELPADKPANYDANDYESDHGPEALGDLLRAFKLPPMRYRLQSADDLLNAPPMRWMVHGVLPAAGFAAVYGPSGSGKSFLAFDLCAAVADGVDWFGQRVNAAPVTYVCLEGEAGLGKRAKAWGIGQRRNLPCRLRFVTQSLDLRQRDDVADLCAAVLAAGGRDGLLVIDTLNRAAPGADENSSVDMGQLIEACKEAQRRLGGMVLLVHHTGKEGAKGLRGHSSLYAALDAAIEVSRNDAHREWSVAKSKDDADGGRHAFTLRVVDLGADVHGEPITSCVVEPHDPANRAPNQKRKPPTGQNAQLAMRVLVQILKESRDLAMGGAPTGRPCVRLEDARAAVMEALPVDPKRKRERADYALTSVLASGAYEMREGWIWCA
ncbi:helicase [Burkholderia ubonensis]|uniref:AAA family ATPase n=1 Tax=Burkholderia ubonensis TaxID=101571 RepID=UPI00075A3FD9|nr:AAA family ATPase [Burkholderia ubonensis]KVD91567.1 helicase [Burkholderia ubonensis]